MKIPKTPIEFDYDLWTTEDGKCMVRVKSTGEVTEVDREVMKALRVEEKRLRRSYGPSSAAETEDGENKPSGTVLSLDALPDEAKASGWLADPHDFTGEIVTEMLAAEFMKRMTQREQEVFTFCVLNGGSQQDYAAVSGLSISRVCKIVSAIRKKAKLFFG